MKKELFILLIAILTATLGFSGAITAAPIGPGPINPGGPVIGPGHHGGTTIIVINRHRHRFHPPIIIFHRHHRFYPPVYHPLYR